MPPDGPLRGIRILDLTRILAGPFATMILGDLGAEVIKVELPDGGDETRRIVPVREGESHYFMSVNRNKKSVAIDMKKPAGRQLVLDLAAISDVVVENFRPGVAARLGVGYEQIQAVNERAVYCSLSAFGQTGPWANRTAFDVAVQALGGPMSLTGEPGGKPMRMGLPMADLSAGLFAAIGILAALTERERSGRGQLVDVGMLDSMVGLLTAFSGRYFMTGEDVEPVGSGHPSVVPYGAYDAKDGHMVIANLGEAFWPRICRALGLDELASDSRFDSNAKRVERRAEVEGLLSERTRQQTIAELDAAFAAHDVPHAPVLSVSQVLNHPQTRAREMVVEVEHPTLGQVAMTGRAIRLPAHGPMKPLPPPLLGQHTAEVLTTLVGCSPAQIEQLAREDVIKLG
jgi:crotonobetainyl-CoA:carnitine CoA-transferase CaiB-like acyl-CoA transferase